MARLRQARPSKLVRLRAPARAGWGSRDRERDQSRDAGHLRPMERKTLVAFCDCGVDVSDSVGRSGGAEGGAGGARGRGGRLVSWV